MKKWSSLFVGSLLVLLVIPYAAMAQGNGTFPPPGCCNEPGVDGEGNVSVPDASLPEIVVSRNLAELMGISLGDFVDRLSYALFPGEWVDLVIERTRLVGPEGFAQSGLEDPGMLLAVEETRFYQLSQPQLSWETLEGVNYVYITDGTVSVKVSFVEAK